MLALLSKEVLLGGLIGSMSPEANLTICFRFTQMLTAGLLPDLAYIGLLGFPNGYDNVRLLQVGTRRLTPSWTILTRDP